MKNLYKVIVLAILISITACSQETKTTATTNNIPATKVMVPATKSKAEILLSETINAHGGALYETANYGFIFRDKKYTFNNDGNKYTYTVTSTKDNQTTKDVLANGVLTRFINDTEDPITEKDVKKYTEALNSVIYFATLPHKLNDPAVNTSYIGQSKFKERSFDVIKVTFNQEGGGEDHDDQYHYWINKASKKIDFLAYNYTVNEGGVRFRTAYNTRVIDGITFQDYVNYKAPVGTPLIDLLGLYERGALIELSKIETENIININQ